MHPPPPGWAVIPYTTSWFLGGGKKAVPEWRFGNVVTLVETHVSDCLGLHILYVARTEGSLEQHFLLENEAFQPFHYYSVMVTFASRPDLLLMMFLPLGWNGIVLNVTAGGKLLYSSVYDKETWRAAPGNERKIKDLQSKSVKRPSGAPIGPFSSGALLLWFVCRPDYQFSSLSSEQRSFTGVQSCSFSSMWRGREGRNVFYLTVIILSCFSSRKISADRILVESPLKPVSGQHWILITSLRGVLLYSHQKLKGNPNPITANSECSNTVEHICLHVAFHMIRYGVLRQPIHCEEKRKEGIDR